MEKPVIIQKWIKIPFKPTIYIQNSVKIDSKNVGITPIDNTMFLFKSKSTKNMLLLYCICSLRYRYKDIFTMIFTMVPNY